MKKKVVSDEQFAVNDIPPLTPPQEEYATGTWKALPHYVCKTCGFDAFYELVMVKHLVNKHNSEAALERLVELESPSHPSTAAKSIASAQDEEGSGSEVYEVELVETGSAVDAQGNEHKKFEIKE